MENKFFVDSEHLSAEALNKKHRLESIYYQVCAFVIYVI